MIFPLLLTRRITRKKDNMKNSLCNPATISHNFYQGLENIKKEVRMGDYNNEF